MVGSIGRGAGIGALSNGVSNMCVTTIDYLAEHGNLNGALDDIAISGFSGVVSGGILGGITGGFIHVKSQLQVSNSKYLKPDGKLIGISMHQIMEELMKVYLKIKQLNKEL